MPHVQPSALLLTMLVCAAVLAPASAAYCCPTCTANNGDCRLIDEVYGLFDSGRACLDACPGSCVKSTTGFACGLEPCGPNPCPTNALLQQDAPTVVPSLRGGRGRDLSAPVGTCKMGFNTTGMPTRDAPGWWGDYAYAVSMASAKAAHEQVAIATHWERDPLEAKLVVANGGNNVYWPVTAAGSGDDSQEWTLDARIGPELVSFNFSLPVDAYPPTVAASDAIVAFVTQGNEVMAYDAQHPPSTLISKVSSIPPNGNGDQNPVFVEGTTVYVLQFDGSSTYTLYSYDAYIPDSITHAVIALKGCNVPGTKDAADTIKGGAVKGGRFLFPAFNQYGGDLFYQLCAADVATGAVSPLLTGVSDYTRAFDSLQVSFFDDGIVYTSYGGDGGIPAGGIVVCTPSAAGGEWTCTWLNQAIKTKSDYTFTSLFVNYHLPAPIDGPGRIVLYEDVVVYRTYGESDDYSFFGYNLTDSSVYPIALLYDVPNTKCDAYTGDNSASLEERSFIEAFLLSNGTLLLGVQYTDTAYGFQQNDVVSVTSSFLRQNVVGCDATGGCALHGGTCINRKCYCQPGCGGTDCSQGPSFCNPTPPPTDDDF